ncbi:MAG: gliding motility-associated C-terminal domain-containing protein [Cyclobacteriaceae bacterium]
MSIRIIAVFLFLLPSLLSAQVVSNAGRFAVDFDRGCNPFTVNVTQLDAFGNITRQYFYEDGATETTSTSYTYTSAGTYQIVQVVGIDVTPKTDTLTIQVFDPTESKFSLEKCNANGIIITSQEDVYDFIRVYFTPTDSSTITSGETASFLYPDNSMQSFQTKGFYLDGKENCTVFSYDVDPISTLTTPIITSSSVKETCRDFFVLELEVSSYDSLIAYQVQIEQATTSTVLTGKISSNSIVVEDIPYSKDESRYCVRINAVDNCTATVLQGTQFCTEITELSSTPFGNLYSSYTENAVFINLDPVSSGSLDIYRKLGETGVYELRNSVQGTHADPIGSLARAYFYRIDYVDSCGETLFSAETNPPLLSSQTLEENSYRISFTDPTSIYTEVNSITYEVGNQSVSSQSITGSSFDIGLDAMNGTRQFLQATVEFLNGPTVRSNRITYKYKPIIYVPKAFTPNSDGLNDTLELFGLPTEIATTSIYTKWGQLIYKSTEPKPGWDGLINGSLAPEGAYLYEVIFEDSDGVKVIQKGTFALIKK